MAGEVMKDSVIMVVIGKEKKKFMVELWQRRLVMEFEVKVTHSNMSAGINRVKLEKKFTTDNDLHKNLEKIVLMNKEGEVYYAKLKKDNSQTRGSAIYDGWRDFCLNNKLEDGDICLFKLLQNEEIPTFKLLSYRKNDDEQLDSHYVTLLVTEASLEDGKQHIPIGFTRANNLTKKWKVTLVDKNDEEYDITVDVKKDRSLVYSRIRSPKWKDFCNANDVNAGEKITLELIKEEEKLMLKFICKSQA
ncbi:unnamed protein product [Eruca vesicaria subsp. sativa]|uniref:TF-B3 domain-containing protein n=1 Tax=Eruca vesicaria subsp. sativa TaxID=29727 RepID=A0ABC8J1W1_ERUVS|nr:unnamed protein product [Eruca vesicaria subsp. sativa]